MNLEKFLVDYSIRKQIPLSNLLELIEEYYPFYDISITDITKLYNDKRKAVLEKYSNRLKEGNLSKNTIRCYRSFIVFLQEKAI